MVNMLQCARGCVGVPAWRAAVQGGAGHHGLPACDAQATKVRHGPKKLAQKDWERLRVLTKARNRAGGPCRDAGVDVGRRRTAELAEEGAVGVRRASGSVEETRRGAVEQERGSEGTEDRRRRVIARIRGYL